VKALSDYIVTSSNAEKIVRSIPADKTILFAPDKNLGPLPREEDRPQDGALAGELHRPRDVQPAKARGPEGAPPRGARHRAPRVRGAVLAMADFIGSTTALLKYAVASPAKEFIVVTEPGILHQMRRQAPDKTFIPAPPEANCACNECPFMKRTRSRRSTSRSAISAPRRDGRGADRAGAKAHRSDAGLVSR
jgi:quinolinate synthase